MKRHVVNPFKMYHYALHHVEFKAPFISSTMRNIFLFPPYFNSSRLLRQKALHVQPMLSVQDYALQLQP